MWGKGGRALIFPRRARPGPHRGGRLCRGLRVWSAVRVSEVPRPSPSSSWLKLGWFWASGLGFEFEILFLRARSFYCCVPDLKTEFQNSTFRFEVLNECVLPDKRNSLSSSDPEFYLRPKILVRKESLTCI